MAPRYQPWIPKLAPTVNTLQQPGHRVADGPFKGCKPVSGGHATNKLKPLPL